MTKRVSQRKINVCAAMSRDSIPPEELAVLERKLWSLTQRGESDECWIYERKSGKDGRGVIWVNRRKFYAPRVALILSGVSIPEGMYACHTCDNPSCVNVAHIFVGSHRDNMRDASKKRRLRGQSATSCIRGHAFSQENTYIDTLNKRVCRTCKRDWDRQNRKVRQ